MALRRPVPGICPALSDDGVNVYRVRHGLSQRERRSAAADEDGHYRCKTGSGTVCPGLYQKTAGLPDSHPDNPGVATWIFFDELGITYTAVVEPPPEESGPSAHPAGDSSDPSGDGSKPEEPSRPGSAPSSDIGGVDTGRPVSRALLLAAAFSLAGFPVCSWPGKTPKGDTGRVKRGKFPKPPGKL